MGDAARQVKIKVGVAKRYVHGLLDRCSSIRTGIMLNLISDVPPPFGLLARSIWTFMLVHIETYFRHASFCSECADEPARSLLLVLARIICTFWFICTLTSKRIMSLVGRVFVSDCWLIEQSHMTDLKGQVSHCSDWYRHMRHLQDTQGIWVLRQGNQDSKRKNRQDEVWKRRFSRHQAAGEPPACSLLSLHFWKVASSNFMSKYV